jgi:hypothetical protein
MLLRLPDLIEMDFQRLFKRKEADPAPPIARDNTRDALNEREVLVCEGELLDDKSPASLAWSNVGGAISIKADKILGILEGRTRIKTAVLQELYPELFEQAPNPGTEFNIPLQAVVTQLKDVFNGTCSEETDLEDFDTPFGQIAREDEARFKDKHADWPEVQPIAAPELLMPPQPGSKPVLKEQDQHAADLDEFRQDPEHHRYCAEQPKPAIEKLSFETELRSAASGGFALSSAARKIQNDKNRREGCEHLQELYLTDEPLDGSTVANLILGLPRVAGVVIMLSNGAMLGGDLSGGFGEALTSLVPDFVNNLLAFTKSAQGGPAKFVTLSGYAFLISLTIGGDVLILARHEGKNLPPGLRERLVATAQALNIIYGSRP